MIASIATAVLPVWRSPMISSRWPRPIGTIESIDFRPVCTGWLDRLTGDHARSDLLDHVGHLGVDRALAVDRLAQRVDHAADQLGADRHFQDAARALDGVAFGDVLVLAQDHRRRRSRARGSAPGRRWGAVGGGREFQHFARPSRRTGRGCGRCRRSPTPRCPGCGCRRWRPRPSMRLLISSEISAGLSCMTLSFPVGLFRRRSGRVQAVSATFICSRRALTEVSSTSSPTTTRMPPIRDGLVLHGDVELAAEALFQRLRPRRPAASASIGKAL